MSTSNRGRAPRSNGWLPIFTSVGERSSQRAGIAILVLMIAAVLAVVAVVVANSVG